MEELRILSGIVRNYSYWSVALRIVTIRISPEAFTYILAVDPSKSVLTQLCIRVGTVADCGS